MQPTALTRLLGVRHPLIQAPMAGGPTTPELVAAVSGAGGFGMLAGYAVDVDALERMIAAVGAATGAPFGVNFLLSARSPAYRAALLGAVETDTVVTTSFTGRPARSIRNRFLAETAGVEPLPWPRQRAAATDLYRTALQRGESDLHPLFTGQNICALRDGQPAAEIVDEAERVLAAL